MMSAKLPSLGLPREEAFRDAAAVASEEEFPTVSSNRSGSGRARGDAMGKQQRKSESKRKASSEEESKDLLLLLPPPSTMAGTESGFD